MQCRSPLIFQTMNTGRSWDLKGFHKITTLVSRRPIPLFYGSHRPMYIFALEPGLLPPEKDIM